MDESGNAITVPVYGTQTITDTAQVSTYDAAGNALGYRVTQNGTTTDYTFSQAAVRGLPGRRRERGEQRRQPELHHTRQPRPGLPAGDDLPGRCG
ncbi:protein of unknown function [Ralstonia solanacearum CMR15]|nr:protein of unknown function [Ralstonia solanacearum CMR15]